MALKIQRDELGRFNIQFCEYFQFFNSDMLKLIKINQMRSYTAIQNKWILKCIIKFTSFGKLL